MKKILMVAIILIASVSSFAQIPFSPEAASKWFKDTYVQSNFKDPYSYKELKLTVDTVNIGSYTRSKISIMERNLTTLETDKVSAQKSVDMAKKYVDKGKDPDGFWVKSLNFNQDRLNKLNSIPSDLETLKKSYESMSESDKKQTHHYNVNIDCHANNSYGGTVLGKYSFSYIDGQFDTKTVFKWN